MGNLFVIIVGVLVALLQVGEIKATPRIVGGVPVNIEDYPYQVSLVYIDTHMCGGSILSPIHILTAAHCTNGFLSSKTDLSIRAGSSQVNEGGQVRQIVEVYQHPDFDSDTYDFDISILKIESGLTLGVGVAVVQLPPRSSPPAEGTNAVATGWGRLSENGPLPLQLQKVDLPTLSWDICEMVYGDQMTKRMICAGYPEGQHDTCQGDSGGPLVANGVQIGVTSWGDGCGAVNSPGVYAEVSYFVDFIEEMMDQ